MIPIKSKQFSRVIVSGMVVLLGLYIGWRMGNIPSDSGAIENLPDERSDRPMSGLLESRSIHAGTENASRFRYPEGAVEDEVVIMFEDSQSYLDYLAALQRAGIEPLGRIDALGVLRLDIATFTRFLKRPRMQLRSVLTSGSLVHHLLWKHFLLWRLN